jgi:short-subunit dehydrogenase
MDSTKVALVTGGTSGIGLAFAQILAREGYSLYIIGQDEERMQEAVEKIQQEYSVSVTPIIQDLSIANAAQEVMNHVSGSIDILINAAGFGLYGDFTKTDMMRERAMVAVNITALMELTKLVLPGMITKKRGKILNIASIAAFQPGPRLAVYYATKAYVLSFSEAIAEEVKGTGVTITTLCPGPTKTHFEDTARLKGSELFKGRLMTAEEVARIGYMAMMQGRRTVIPGIKNRIFSMGVRFVPIRVAAYLASYVQRPL